MTLPTRAAVLLALTGAVASFALAAPPSEEDLKARGEAFRAAYSQAEGDETKIRAAAAEAVKDLAIDEMSAAQIAKFAYMIHFGGRESEAIARLDQLAADRTGAGAKAAVVKLQFIDGDSTPAAQQAEAVRTVLNHPGLGEAMRTGDAFDLFNQMSGASKEAQELFAADAAKLASLLSADLPLPMVARLPGAVATMNNLKGMKPEASAAFRTRAADLVRTGVERADNERTKKQLESALARLEGAALQGKLINHAAPAMTISWSSDPSIKSIDDLKGKVVVLDFWATWCGPCIASFPAVRELQSHYEGYPVAIVGVTSLQGAHFGAGGKIDTKGDPQKEYSLMPGFMAEKEMTWPVVFTQQEVFNPDYGVMGIPHVAILAPDGTVRHNALHPASPLEEKTAKINAILKEFELAAPTE